MNSVSSPHDLLPIPNPKTDPNKHNPLFFYDKVCTPLLKDIIRMEAFGIPIDLNEVMKLEVEVSKVLESVSTNLANNPLIQIFTGKCSDSAKDDKANALLNKKRKPDYYYKEFSITNSIHRTYVINTYLEIAGKQDMMLDKWSIADLKKLNQVMTDSFIAGIINKDIKEWMMVYIIEGMWKLAITQSEIYNKGIADKIAELDTKKTYVKFNPNSAPQKQAFFNMFGIESENTTKTGNDQWNKESLEVLQTWLKFQIEQEEQNITGDDSE